jgi:hypothetical protein
MDDERKQLELFDHQSWAVIHGYCAGDVAFKVDLDGREPRDWIAVARVLSRRWHVPVAWPDERTLAPNAAVLCSPDGCETDVAIEDIENGDGQLLGLRLNQVS